MDTMFSLSLVVPEIMLSLSGLVLLLFAAWGGDRASAARSRRPPASLGGVQGLVAPTLVPALRGRTRSLSAASFVPMPSPALPS